MINLEFDENKVENKEKDISDTESLPDYVHPKDLPGFKEEQEKLKQNNFGGSSSSTQKNNNKSSNKNQKEKSLKKDNSEEDLYSTNDDVQKNAEDSETQ